MDLASDLVPDRQSIIDRKKESSNHRLSIIDGTTSMRTLELQEQLRDSSLGEEFVCKVYNRLGEDQIRNIAAYAAKKAHSNAGHLFVRICMNTMRKKGLVE